MKSKTLNLLLAAGLFLAPTLSLRANVDSILELDMRGYFQAKSSTSSNRETGKVDIVRLDAKQLLALLQKKVGVKFNGGSRLKLATDGSVFVVNSKGAVVGDVSQYIKTVADYDNGLFNGIRNLSTNEEKGRTYYPITIKFNIPGFVGQVSGVVIEDFTVSPATKTGIQFLSGNGRAGINGQGQINGKGAYFEGSMTLQGKEAVIAK